MKFGKVLAKHASDYPRYKNYFISYKELKVAINNMKESNASINAAESHLQDLLNRELEKVNNFADLQAESLDGQLQGLHRAISKPDVTEEQVDNVEASLDNLADEIVFLDFFVQVNSTGFRKITKKCDKHLGTSFSTVFMSRVLRERFSERFMKLETDKLLGFLATCYEEWRGCCKKLTRATSDATFEAEEERGGTAKFWMNPDQATRAKVLILKYMNNASAVETTTPQHIIRRRMSGGVDQLAVPGVAKQQTHVYLDNAAGVQYKERFAGG
jgi:SPX domain protein involved in polyphosphate accumulation